MITIQSYSEKSVVIRGDTKPSREHLKMLGGRWNPNLEGGPGWIFSKKRETELTAWVHTLRPKPPGLRKLLEQRETESDYTTADEFSDDEDYMSSEE